MWRKFHLLCYIAGAALVIYGGVKAWQQMHISAPPITSVKAKEKVQTKQENPKQPVRLYKAIPQNGENIGVLEIPKVGTLPIIQGAGYDELERGVGHVAQSALPGEADNVVLAGHRDTVFRRLGEVKVGDTLVVKNDVGNFTYQVKQIRIVDKDDRTVIVSTYPHPRLTLVTCYPLTYVGPAPKRLVLIADLVGTSV